MWYLLPKDGSVLLKFLQILEKDECGYDDLVKKLYSEMDELQEQKNMKPSKLYTALFVVYFVYCNSRMRRDGGSREGVSYTYEHTN